MSQNISRRTVAKGAAWAVPAIAVASTAPAFAASNDLPTGFDDPNTPELDGCSAAFVQTNYSGTSTVVGGPAITWSSPDHPDVATLKPGKPAVVYTLAGNPGCGIGSMSFFVAFPVRKKLHARADDEYVWDQACQAPVQATSVKLTGIASKDGSAFLVNNGWYNTNSETTAKSAPAVDSTTFSSQGPTSYTSYGKDVPTNYDPYTPANLSNPYSGFGGPIRLTGNEGESTFTLTYIYKPGDNADPGFGTFTLTQTITVITVASEKDVPVGGTYFAPYCPE